MHEKFKIIKNKNNLKYTMKRILKNTLSLTIGKLKIMFLLYPS